MWQITEKDIIDVFNRIKKLIGVEIKRENYSRALYLIDRAAVWGYFYNFQYADDDLEKNIQVLSNHYKEVQSLDNQVPLTEKVMLVTSRMSDNHELIRQYARALVRSGKPAKIISYGTTDSNKKSPNLFREIDGKIEIEWIEDTDNYEDAVLSMSKIIYDYNPSVILTHIIPWDVRSVVAVMAAKNCFCYNICFNDHSFWIGKSMLDYLIEFRPYGATISVEKRGIDPNKLIHIPYYPIVSEDVKFQGFPFDRKDRIVFFSGGDGYKMMDKSNTYFNNIDRILEENPKAVFFLASGRTDFMRLKTKNLKNYRRIYISGNRKDIYAVFQNCDIYYGTYPIVGALMSEYAAMCGKPVVARANKKPGLEEIGGILNHKYPDNVAFQTNEEMCNYAHRLCEDEVFRKAEGQRLKNNMTTRDDFEINVCNALNNKMEPFVFQPLDMDYEGIENYYREYSVTYSNAHVGVPYRVFGLKSLRYWPKLLPYFMRAALIHN